MTEAVVFDIKEFSIHDGPGARITVFLKGCPLRCRWCHNPEGLSVKPQLMYKKTLCTQCGACLKGCAHPECQGLPRCVHACPNGCLSIAGERITAQALAEKLKKNADFFSLTGGGITVSGGEPMMHSDFVMELADHLPGIHKAIQTSGHCPPEVYRAVVDKFDYVMQDIKLADPQLHKEFTGVDNHWILENVQWLKTSGKAFIFRTPLIPGITDTQENLEAIRRITDGYPSELLKYNALAGAKYEMLGMEYTL